LQPSTTHILRERYRIKTGSRDLTKHVVSKSVRALDARVEFMGDGVKDAIGEGPRFTPDFERLGG
jgi:hypothetical protein